MVNWVCQVVLRRVIRPDWHESLQSIYIYIYCKHNLSQTKLMALSDDEKEP